MKNKKEREPENKSPERDAQSEKQVRDSLSIHGELELIRKQIEEFRKTAAESKDKAEDLEIHINLLTRFITTVCIEKLGMRVGVLKRLIKRIEKEAIRESQITHLESLYKLPPRPGKKNSSPPPRSKNDPWEEIS